MATFSLDRKLWGWGSRCIRCRRRCSIWRGRFVGSALLSHSPCRFRRWIRYECRIRGGRYRMIWRACDHRSLSPRDAHRRQGVSRRGAGARRGFFAGPGFCRLSAKRSRHRTHLADCPARALGGDSLWRRIERGRRNRTRCSDAESFSAVLSLDLCALDQLLQVDRASRCARIRRRVWSVYRTAAQTARLHPASLPQSFEFSTLGGWIATRAGGHFATLYTHIDDLVESLRMVTPQGTLETRRLPGNGAGPQQERLVLRFGRCIWGDFEAWLRVQELPQHRASCIVRFPSFALGAQACRALSQSGLFPANARLIEADEALFMESAMAHSTCCCSGLSRRSFPSKTSYKRRWRCAARRAERRAGPRFAAAIVNWKTIRRRSGSSRCAGAVPPR